MEIDKTLLKHVEKIATEVFRERQDQQARWGKTWGKENSRNDWVSHVVLYLGQAVNTDGSSFRAVMVKVAALCFAAVEWHDRKKK